MLRCSNHHRDQFRTFLHHFKYFRTVLALFFILCSSFWARFYTIVNYEVFRAERINPWNRIFLWGAPKTWNFGAGNAIILRWRPKFSKKVSDFPLASQKFPKTPKKRWNSHFFGQSALLLAHSGPKLRGIWARKALFFFFCAASPN